MTCLELIFIANMRVNINNVIIQLVYKKDFVNGSFFYFLSTMLYCIFWKHKG